MVLLIGTTHNTRIKSGEITTFKNETSTTSWSDLPVVVVISGARNKNWQKENMSKVYGDINSINFNLQTGVKLTTGSSFPAQDVLRQIV